MRAKGILAFLILSVATAAVRSEPALPPKTVVLTFDDAVKSQLEIVAPLLKQYGFGATFFISHGWMNDREHFMSWEEVAQLHRMGFEIGNHTWTHAGFNTPHTAARLAGELALVENELAKVSVPKPISFAWPGNDFCPEALAVLERAGYKLGRRGMQPEAAYGSLELGPLFEPHRYHRLLIPSAGEAYPNWTLEHFKQVVDRAALGKAVVVQFHGVPDLAHPWVNTPVDNFRSYMDYLKDGGFHVIALRDLLPYLPEKAEEDDAIAHTQFPAGPGAGFYWGTETEQTRQLLDFWLVNMVRDHRYSMEEAMQVCRLPNKAMQERLSHLDTASAFPSNAGAIKVLPYPGGRHPRIGFLEGAIDPLRGTKVSIFPPWSNGGYFVLDLPEAIFSNLGLAFLAHTHVPTIWNAQNITIENEDWTISADGRLRSQWRLPNGITFGALVKPASDAVDLELWLENGTKETLTGLRTQICLMLKAAPGFNAQTQEGKTYAKPLVTAKAFDANRYVLLAFEHCGRAWGNEKCPCVHSDPVLPDAEPGQKVSVRGRLSFYEGSNFEEEQRRFRQRLSW